MNKFLNKLFSKIYRKMQKSYIKLKHEKYREKYDIHPSFRFNGEEISFYGNGKLFIKEGSYIGNLSTIQLHENHSVTIGKGCSISHNVRIYTSSKVPDYDFQYKRDAPLKSGDVHIGDYSWIGANVFINPGVKIGENSVVGANSIVTKNVEAFSIYGGVPAKLIRRKRLNA